MKCALLTIVIVGDLPLVSSLGPEEVVIPTECQVPGSIGSGETE